MPQPVPVLAAEVMNAWRLLLEVHHRLTDDMDQELRRTHGLRLDWYDVLVQLNAAGGRMRMHELAEATLFSRTDCTRIVDRMEAADLVRRERASEDGRGVYAVLTAAGSRLLREAAATHVASIEARFAAHLTPAEAHTMSTALSRVITAHAE